MEKNKVSISVIQCKVEQNNKRVELQLRIDLLYKSLVNDKMTLIERDSKINKTYKLLRELKRLNN